MSSDQSRSASGAGSPANGAISGTNAGTGTGAGTSTTTPLIASSLKKRPRLTALTPTGLLRQKKRRIAAASTSASASASGPSPASAIVSTNVTLTTSSVAGLIRKPLIRSGASTPTKPRNPMSSISTVSLDNLVIPMGPEKKARRGSLMGMSAPGDGEQQDTDKGMDGRRRSGSNTGMNSNDALSSFSASAAAVSGGGGPADYEEFSDLGASSSMGGGPAGASGGGGGGGGSTSDTEDSITLVHQSKAEIKEMWDQMTDNQRQRYDVYRRTALNKGSVKKLAYHILNQQISSTLTFVLAGFSKVFVGEIVERAVQLRVERGEAEEGPLKPEHLREAYRLYKKETQTGSSSGFTKRLF